MTPGGSPLRYAGLDEVVPDAERLLEGRTTVGNGSLAQIRLDLVDAHRRLLRRTPEVVSSEIAVMSLHLHWLPPAELFDSVEDALVWVKDRDGRYRWVNRAFLINFAMDDRFGPGSAGLQDVIGKTDYDLSPAFLADQFRLDDEYVLAGNRIVDRIELVEQPDGLTVWNLTNKIPLMDADGSVVGTAGLTRNLGATRQGLEPASGFGPVLAYLRDHYHTTVTNRQLAKLSHMSVRAFERKFQASFHLTPQKYLRKLRMRMASRALVYARESMAEVAIGCGFSDQSHFTREFRRHFGRTPREYREYYTREAGNAAPVTNPAAVEQAPVPPVRYRQPR